MPAGRANREQEGRTDGPRAPMVAGLCVVLALAYAGELVFAWRQGPDELTALLERFGLVPRAFLAGRWYTPLSAMFLHAGALHLLSNLAFLAGFGRGLEPRLGARGILGLYFGAGVAAAGLHVALAPTSFVASLGASGAVSGLLGAYLRLRPGDAPSRGRIAALALIALWLLLQIPAAATEGVAAWAHVGGFVAGFLAAPWLDSGTPRPDSGSRRTL